MINYEQYKYLLCKKYNNITCIYNSLVYIRKVK